MATPLDNIEPGTFLVVEFSHGEGGGGDCKAWGMYPIDKGTIDSGPIQFVLTAGSPNIDAIDVERGATGIVKRISRRISAMISGTSEAAANKPSIEGQIIISKKFVGASPQEMINSLK